MHLHPYHRIYPARGVQLHLVQGEFLNLANSSTKNTGKFFTDLNVSEPASVRATLYAYSNKGFQGSTRLNCFCTPLYFSKKFKK